MSGKLKNGKFAVEVEELPVLWTDKKRHLGLPISITRYSLNADKLIVNKGFFNLEELEVLLYRVRDISVKQSFFERIFGVGTVCVISTDETIPHLDLIHVKYPRKVKEVLSKCVEESRKKNGIRSTELMSGGGAGFDPDNMPDGPAPVDMDGDGVPDFDEAH